MERYLHILKNQAEEINSEAVYSRKLEKIIEFYKYAKSLTDVTSDELNPIIDSFFLNKYGSTFDSPLITYEPVFYLIKDSNCFDFNSLTSNINIDNFSSTEEFLDYVVLLTRNNIVYRDFGVKQFENFKDVPTINLCAEISSDIKGIFDSLKIKNNIVKLLQGFSNNVFDFDNYIRFHFFNIVTFGNDSYLIDCSYSQFFDTMPNVLESLGIEDNFLPFPGVYMLQDKFKLDVARTILEKGYIKLTEDVLKAYCDGFALSFRNGLFYENLGIVDYRTEYTANDYENFLFGDDSQFKREGKGVLGYQEGKLTKDLDFSKGTILYENNQKKLIRFNQN